MEATVVGIFSVVASGYRRWEVTNQRFGYKYVTFGPWEEVHDLLMDQTKAWERKLGAKGHGDGWRGKMQLSRTQAS